MLPLIAADDPVTPPSEKLRIRQFPSGDTLRSIRRLGTAFIKNNVERAKKGGVDVLACWAIR